MATHIFHSGNGAISQVANAWTLDPAAPVKLKKDGDPGAAPHANDSSSIWNPLGTISEFGTDVANFWSAMDVGQHAPQVLVGLYTNVRDETNAFVSGAKTVYHEAGQMVHHGVTTLVNSIMVRLSPGMVQVIDNAEAVMSGMNVGHFKDAAADQVAALLDMLKDPATYGGLAVSIAATAVQGVPVVGQIVGGAVAVDRAMGIGAAAADAAKELQAIASTWEQPMTPEQLEEARGRLAAWLTGGGAALLAALAGRRIAIHRNSRSSAKNDNNIPVNSDQAGNKGGTTQGPCATCKPVIIATGEKTLTETDFSLPGPIPLVWQRHYRSGNIDNSPWGPGWSLPYTSELRLGAEGMILADERGRQIKLPSVALGAEYFDPVEKITLAHPEAQRWTITFKDGLRHHFVRVDSAQWRLPLAAITDRNGHAVRLHWQRPDTQDADAFSFAEPRLTAITDSAGRRLHLHWQHARLSAVELDGTPAHTLVRYHYDGSGALVATDRADLPWRRYAWRGGVLVGYRKASGHRFFADYDIEGPHGRVLRSWSADGTEADHFDYDTRHRRTRLTDALGRDTVWRYDARFDIVETKSADGTRTQTPFDTRGNPRGSVDALGRRTQLRFDARGNLTALHQPDGAVTTLAYNALDLPTTLTDALGQRWLSDYDARGNLVTSTDPLGRSTAYAYDEAGRLYQITDARGGIKRLAWDDAHNLVAYTDCSGHTTRFSYDAQGRLCTRTDALGHTTQYRWSPAGQLIELVEPCAPGVAQPPTHRYDWDGEGNLTAYTDPLGATTAYTYDGAGRPLSRRDGAGRTLAYDYDGAGRLICLTNENGARTTFRYDLADNLTDEIGFDGRHQRYCYNAAGELTHLVEAGGSELGPGKLTHFARDAMGRLLERRAEADPTCTSRFSYDKLGRLTAAHNPAATVAFAYDPLGQLLAETQTLAGGAPRVLGHAYDVLGNRTRTLLPDGRVLNALFYGSGHLHQLNLEADGSHHTICDVERDALHREVCRTQGQLASRFDYDPMGRLTRHRSSLAQAQAGRVQGARADAGTAVLERRYGWDAAGNLITRVDQLRGTQAFRYDPTGRILEATGPRPESFAFDPAGNLLDPIDRAIGYPALDNRIAVFEDLRFDYDAHGNVTRRRKGAHELAELSWNAEHQLAQSTVTRHGVTQTTRYEYDALGRRTRKRDAFGATEYLWDGDLMIESRRNNKSALYLYEPDSFVPLATVQHNDTYWYHCDQIGAPMELTDADGRIVWAADYRVWGEATVRKTGTDGRAVSSHTPAPPPIEQPFRFQGQQFDEETGLHYNRFRYYDPGVGRFASQDPIGYAGGYNLFGYGPNPLAWIDPSGLAKKLPAGTYSTHSQNTQPAKVGGRSVINKCYAGKVYPAEHLPAAIRGKYPHGVPFNMQGFPDFTRYAIKNVNIEPGSSRGADFSRANSAAFGKGNPFGNASPTIDGVKYTWHHHQDSGRMQLVPEDIHDAVKHTGGFSKNCG